MSFKPASDWIDAFPEEPSIPPRPLPPARVRTRSSPPPSPNETADLTELTPIPREPSPAPAIVETAASNVSETAAYAVGYGKPPRHSQFQPGRSGNPRGRPRGTKSLNTLVRENLTQKVSVRTASGEKRISRMEALLLKAIEQAMKGNGRALSEMLKLYANAVPDVKPIAPSDTQRDDLTAADWASIEEFRREVALQTGAVP